MQGAGGGGQGAGQAEGGAKQRRFLQEAANQELGFVRAMTWVLVGMAMGRRPPTAGGLGFRA